MAGDALPLTARSRLRAPITYNRAFSQVTRPLKTRRFSHELSKSGRAVEGPEEPGRHAPQFADRSVRLSRGGPRVHQLERRAARVAGNVRAVQSVVPHDRHV